MTSEWPVVRAGRRRAAHQRGTAIILMSILDEKEWLFACRANAYMLQLEPGRRLGMTFTLSDQVYTRVEFLFPGLVSASVRDLARTSRTRRVGG